jgi:hypothetical protein
VRKAVGAAVGFVVVLMLMGSKEGCASSGGVSSGNLNKETAIEACEGSVKKQLKAPSTADFSDEHARRVGSDLYRVRGSVDAENSFSAKLRITWSGVATTDDGGDTWSCLASLDE